MTSAVRLTGNPDADALLDGDANALLIGMVLDQQVPMEKAFSGPWVIAQRMGGRSTSRPSPSTSEEEFVALCSERPAIHRFPGAMAKRVRAVCTVLAEQYDGRCRERLAQRPTGAEVFAALAALPGFGTEKAQIFTALLGKQREDPRRRLAGGGRGVRRGRRVPLGGRHRRRRLAGAGARDQEGGQGRTARGDSRPGRLIAARRRALGPAIAHAAGGG